MPVSDLELVWWRFFSGSIPATLAFVVGLHALLMALLVMVLLAVQVCVLFVVGILALAFGVGIWLWL